MIRTSYIILGACFCLSLLTGFDYQPLLTPSVPSLPATVCYGINCPGNPALPALSSPVIFQSGTHTYNGSSYTVDATGTSDMDAAFQAALTQGDVEVYPGLYYLAPRSLGAGGSVNIPSGRNIRCCSDSGGDCSDTNPLHYNAQGGSVAFTTSKNSIGVVYETMYWGDGVVGGSLIGCQFRGNNYNITGQPHSTWNGQPDSTTQGAVLVQGAGQHGTLFAYNDFNGIGGNSGAMNFTSHHNNGGLGPEHDDLVEWNTFEHCGFNSWILDALNNSNQFLHNKSVDCSPDIEAFSSRSAGPTPPLGTFLEAYPTGNVMAYNDIHFVYGSGLCYQATGHPNNEYCDYVDWGASCPHCTTADTSDYSGNLAMYNYIKDDSATQFRVGLLEGCRVQSSPDCLGYNNAWNIGMTIPSVFISNKCDPTTNCYAWNTHGHNYAANSNLTYPASDTTKSNQ